MSILDVANQFFDACETGKEWGGKISTLSVHRGKPIVTVSTAANSGRHEYDSRTFKQGCFHDGAAKAASSVGHENGSVMINYPESAGSLI